MKKFISIFAVFLLMFTAISAFPVSADVGNAYKNYLSAFNYKEYTGQKVEFEEVIIEHIPDGYFYSLPYIVPFSDVISGSFFLCDKFIYGQFRDSDNLYYIIFSKGNTPADYQEQIFLSSSPIYLRGDNDSYIYFDSDSDILCYTLGFSYDSDNKVYRGGALYVNKNYFAYGESYSKYKSIRYDKNTTSIKSTQFTPRIDKENYSSVTWKNIFSNCDLLDRSYLPNVSERNLPLAGGDLSNLIDKIDLKLTPEFGIDMDRVYDKTTGLNDYFKFEITNNSAKNFQWALSIVTVKQYETYINNSSVIVTPDAEPPWTYLLIENYYNETEEYNKKLLFDETYIYPELYTGLFQYHLLKSGESYSDVVAWENVNIKPNEEYVIVLSGYFTDYNYVSDIFRGCNPDGEFEPYPSETTTDKSDIFNSKTYDGKLSDYQLSRPDLAIVYSCNFSVLTIPDFNKKVSIGKGLSYEGSPNELYDKVKNWQSKTNITNNPNLSKTEYNSGYVDPGLINVSSVSVDLSNVSIDDVKGYVASCSSFFDVLATAFYCFPSYIWVLICFGLTALIVIGILKALL